MNRDVRSKDNSEDVMLKRPGIHDQSPYGMYHKEESQYGPRTTESSRGSVGSLCSPLRQNEKNGSFFKQALSKNLFVVVTVLIVILGVGVEVLFPPLVPEERGYRQFNASLKNLQKTFKNQTEQLWRVFLATAKPVLLHKMPKHPAVIFLKGSKTSVAVTDCLAGKLSESLNDAFGVKTPVSVFDSRKYQDWEADKVKQEINDKLTKAFQSGAKVAVILALESLPGDSLVIVNRFCDAADAPFKKVVLIVTLNVEQESTSEKDKEAHKETTKLREPVVITDQINTLLSHFRQSVADVRDEENQLNCLAGKG